MRFADRADAGEQLARLVARHDIAELAPVVLGLPRGGIPVAAPVAARLEAPLDVLVVRKLGAPARPELGLGAVGEEDVRVVDDALVARLGVTDDELAEVTARERAELARRVAVYRGGGGPVPLEGRAVVLVDDGIATGGSVRAALAVLAARHAAEVVLAVPVAATDVTARLAPAVDDVVVVHRPPRLDAVSAAYADFTATTDAEVVAALAAR